MRIDGVAPEQRIRALETTLTELSRLQGVARAADETFIAFLIASAQRAAGARLDELAEVSEQRTDA
jgi:hypothetical protein